MAPKAAAPAANPPRTMPVWARNARRSVPSPVDPAWSRDCSDWCSNQSAPMPATAPITLGRAACHGVLRRVG